MHQVYSNLNKKNKINRIIFSEKLIRTQAQLLVQGGYLAAGYQYIIIDDCWLAHTRAPVNFEDKKKQ